MVFSKYRKAVTVLTAVAIMSLGGSSAFAATSSLTLTPVNNVDITKIEFQKVDASSLKVVGKVDVKSVKGKKKQNTAKRLE